MRLDQFLLQPLHRALQLLDARLELIGWSRRQPHVLHLDHRAGNDPRDRDEREGDNEEVGIHGPILRAAGTGGYYSAGRKKAR